MLKPSILYQDELKKKHFAFSQEIENQFLQHCSYADILEDQTSTWSTISYVSVDKNDKVIGYFSASVYNTAWFIQSLSVANSGSPRNATFSMDCREFLRYLFEVRNFNKIKFKASSGNPALAQYTRILKKYNGRVIGTSYKDVKGQDGKIYDTIEMEIHRDDYIRARDAHLMERRWNQLQETLETRETLTPEGTEIL